MPEHADTDDEIASCFDVMAELRPHLEREKFVKLIRSMQADGFRLACIRTEGRVVAVAGYRISTNLFLGHNLYVDDLVTAETERSKGFGRVLLAGCAAWPSRTAAAPSTSIRECSASVRTSSTCAKASNSAVITSASGSTGAERPHPCHESSSRLAPSRMPRSRPGHAPLPAGIRISPICSGVMACHRCGHAAPASPR